MGEEGEGERKHGEIYTGRGREKRGGEGKRRKRYMEGRRRKVRKREIYSEHILLLCLETPKSFSKYGLLEGNEKVREER